MQCNTFLALGSCFSEGFRPHPGRFLCSVFKVSEQITTRGSTWHTIRTFVCSSLHCSSALQLCTRSYVILIAIDLILTTEQISHRLTHMFCTVILFRTTHQSQVHTCVPYHEDARARVTLLSLSRLWPPPHVHQIVFITIYIHME